MEPQIGTTLIVGRGLPALVAASAALGRGHRALFADDTLVPAAGFHSGLLPFANAGALPAGPYLQHLQSGLELLRDLLGDAFSPTPALAALSPAWWISPEGADFSRSLPLGPSKSFSGSGNFALLQLRGLAEQHNQGRLRFIQADLAEKAHPCPNLTPLAFQIPMSGDKASLSEPIHPVTLAQWMDEEAFLLEFAANLKPQLAHRDGLLIPCILGIRTPHKNHALLERELGIPIIEMAEQLPQINSLRLLVALNEAFANHNLAYAGPVLSLSAQPAQRIKVKTQSLGWLDADEIIITDALEPGGAGHDALAAALGKAQCEQILASPMAAATRDLQADLIADAHFSPLAQRCRSAIPRLHLGGQALLGAPSHPAHQALCIALAHCAATQPPAPLEHAHA